MRVCVIGAGACIEQNLEVDCFEKTSSIGGLWNYRPNEDNVGANVMASTVPPPPEWPNFMHHSYVQKYLEMYAKHFDLIKHIYFNTEVIEVRRIEEDDQDRFKKWSVSLSNGITKIYSAVLICTGHHCEPRIPNQINGLTTFKGRVLHSKHYRDYKGFENKRVMLVGIGNSSLDIAVELAGIAKNKSSIKVVISTRRGTWLFNRITQKGLPYDVDDINYIDEYCVYTKDGRCYQVDVIILCTGYSFGFPFIKPTGLVPVTEDNQVDLYKLILPPSPSAKGLAVIGLVQPIGSVSPIAEMQARWVTSILAKGLNSLPNEAKMREEIVCRRERMRRQYFESAKHTIQVQYLPYMDELAEQIGCSPPNIKKILWKEPSFALRLLFGPNVPYIYRLQGPNTWADARKVIEGVPYRVKTPLKQRFQIIKNKNTKKGHADSLFDYSMTKCLALYFTIIFGVGVCIAIIIVAFMGYIFYFDVSWL
uniref:Flavin-containing monooxygenase n=1 Tax=Meloidogyne javanica TaxID=6303 RepID=A0A915MAQ1_MELJA